MTRKEIIRKNIRELKAKYGKTNKDVGEALNLANANQKMAKNGSPFTDDEILNLCVMFGCEPNDILRGAKNETN